MSVPAVKLGLDYTLEHKYTREEGRIYLSGVQALVRLPLMQLEFVSAMMPILNPAGVQDILDMGLLGWAMSRFTRRWVGFKTIAETVESSASVYVNPHQLDIMLPEDFRITRRRLEHPLARSAAEPGNASAPVRGQGRVRVRARESHRPRRHRFAEGATEKRRRRKRGKIEDPKKRVFINSLVCEGRATATRIIRASRASARVSSRSMAAG